ncbi:DoxX family membrane protein [Candidatus Kaiserbacteria bacterium]|nr:DoxX family membrane protein [Candidatus Kaiserbacteria bacterium]
MNRQSAAHLALRLGVAFAFFYPPIAALSDPTSWAAYFPSFVHMLPINATILLHAFGIVEVIIALWILSGWRIRIPAVIATLVLLAIVVFNANQFAVLFRDLSIAAMALALALWPSPASA